MENRSYKKWTTHEDTVLRKYLEKHPENLHYCFFLASKELGRSAKAVEFRWYGHLKKQTKSGFVFMLFSRLKQLVNIKNQRKDYGK